MTQCRQRTVCQICDKPGHIAKRCYTSHPPINNTNYRNNSYNYRNERPNRGNYSAPRHSMGANQAN